MPTNNSTVVCPDLVDKNWNTWPPSSNINNLNILASCRRGDSFPPTIDYKSEKGEFSHTYPKVCQTHT